MTAKPAVNWATLKREDFDRLIEALIHREHPDGEVHVIDGRGGDGGSDVDVIRQDGQRIIYQLKYFPQGFTGPWVKRRDQIKRSFKSIVDDEPYRWVLVSPNKFTPSEWAYVNGLPPTGHPTNITAWDQARLDSKLAKHPDLIGYLQRDNELERLTTLYRQETAVMTAPSTDLAQRVTDLGSIIDTVDPNYTFNFSRRGSTTINELVAKHPRADEVSPIKIQFNAIADSGSQEDDSLHRILSFGARDSFTLSGDNIQDFKVTGTALLADLSNPSQIKFLPGPPGKPFPCMLDTQDEHGQRVRRFRGTIVYAGTGHDGRVLEFCFYDAVTLKVWISNETSKPVRCDCQLHAGADNITPQQVEAAAALSRAVVNGSALQFLTPEGKPLMRLLSTPAAVRDDFASEMLQLQQLAEDLIKVGDQLAGELAMPKEHSNLDRILLRVLRRALEGKVSFHPLAEAYRATIQPGETHEHIDLFLNGKSSVAFFQQNDPDIDELAQGLDVPRLSFWHPNVALENSEDELQELRDKHAAGEKVSVKLVSQDGTNFRVYLIDRVKTGDTTEIPWNLEGIDEPNGITPKTEKTPPDSS